MFSVTEPKRTINSISNDQRTTWGFYESLPFSSPHMTMNYVVIVSNELQVWRLVSLNSLIRWLSLIENHPNVWLRTNRKSLCEFFVSHSKTTTAQRYKEAIRSGNMNVTIAYYSLLSNQLNSTRVKCHCWCQIGLTIHSNSAIDTSTWCGLGHARRPSQKTIIQGV